jgi:hypothetical protein
MEPDAPTVKFTPLTPMTSIVALVIELDKVHPDAESVDCKMLFVAAGSTKRAGHPAVPPLVK